MGKKMEAFEAYFSDDIGFTQGNLYYNDLIQYFPVPFNSAPLNEGSIFKSSSGLIVPEESCRLHVDWQIFIVEGAATSDAVIGGKMIRNPVTSTAVTDAGWAGDWKPAGLGTFWSIPGMAFMQGSMTTSASSTDVFGLFCVCTPASSTGTVTVHGHHCHTWMHGFTF